jgi:hypothetical protein
MQEVLPVVRIDGARIGNGPAGPVEPRARTPFPPSALRLRPRRMRAAGAEGLRRDCGCRERLGSNTAWLENYLPRAASLAADMKQSHGLDVELVPGAKGSFEVVRGRPQAVEQARFGPLPEQQRNHRPAR